MDMESQRKKRYALIYLSTVGILLGINACTSAPPLKTQNKTMESSVAPLNTSAHQEGRFEVTPLIGDFKVKRTTLANGLKLLVVEDSSSPTFAYHTWFDVGSRHEVAGKTGLAHLFEHMMFKGSQKYPEGVFDALLEKAGAEGQNAFTANDHTAYHVELPKDQLDLIITLESDRMVNLVVDDQSFSTEREVVKGERHYRTDNSPEGVIYQTLFEMMFTQHPYHWPVIGYEEDLDGMSAQDARDFYQRFYAPDRATIVVVGDVDADEVLKKIEKAYGAIPAKRTPDPIHPQDLPQTAQRRKKLPLHIENQKLWMGYHAPESQSPDNAVLDAIQAILSDGMSSRLDRALVETGICSSVSSGSFELKDPGIFAIMTDLQKGKSAAVAESIILREIERLKTTPVSAEELQRGKNLYRFHFLDRLTTGDGIAHFLGDMEVLYGNFTKGLEFQNQVHEVTPERLMQVTQKYFTTDNLTVIVGVPKK